MRILVLQDEMMLGPINIVMSTMYNKSHIKYNQAMKTQNINK